MGQVLYEPGDTIAHVYFPLDAVCSLLTLLDDGTTVEAAMAGVDGMVGLPLFLGLESDVVRTLAQVPGPAVRMTANAFRAALGQDGDLATVLRRYTQALMAQMSQSIGCIPRHPIEERCARWLLRTHDLVGADEFVLTQDFLSRMLGVRRASVTVAAGMLQQAGLIRYHRGRITILDREGLESASCECYRVIVSTSRRLLGDGRTPAP
jgi:CRP-like cAMP-binding protein